MTEEQPDGTSREQLLHEVLPHLELTGIHFLELNARRLDYEPDDDELPPDLDEVDQENVPLMGVAAQQNDEQLLVKVQGTIRTDSVQVRIAVGATYGKAKPLVLDQATTSIFIEKVAIMAMYPFIRQAVHDMSSRLGSPATLHLLRAGQVAMADEGELGAPDESADTSASS